MGPAPRTARRLHPRLQFDIGYRDLASAIPPPPAPGFSEARLGARLGADGRHVLAGLSLRSLLDLWLQARAFPAGGRIIMSAATIADMASIVRAHGLTPVPVDIALDTLAPIPEALERELGAGAHAVVIAEIYGTRIDLSPYRALCRAYGAALVQDAAQALDPTRYEGDRAADLTLLSFGPIKTAAALGGGIALIADGATDRRMRALRDAQPRAGEAAFIRRAMKFAALRTLASPAIYAALVRAIAATGRDPDATLGAAARGFPPGELLKRLRRQPSARLLAMMVRRLAREGPRTARAARGETLSRLLGDAVEQPGRAAPGNAYWLFPVLSTDPEALVRALRAAGFDATRGATSMRALEGPDGARPPNAARLMDHVVYLPIVASMDDGELARMARIVLDQQAGEPTGKPE